MQINESVFARIEALMARAKSGSGATVEEARTSAQTAIDLLAKYGLTLRDIRNEKEKMVRLEADLAEAYAIINDLEYMSPVEMGRRGGLKGGHARAAKLSPKRRLEISRRANKAKEQKRLAKLRGT